MVFTAGNYKMFKLAMDWPRIMKYWHQQEFVFLSAPYFVTGWTLAMKLRLTVIVSSVLLLSK